MLRDRLRAQLTSHLEKRRQAGSLRSLKRPTSNVHHQFSSNDYLDLSTYAPLRAVFARYMEEEESLASTGSRLLSGNTDLAEVIELEASTFWGSEEALIVGTGYEANVSIFSTLPMPGDTVIYDELIHASVHVGLKTSRATHKHAFRHNDTTHLRTLLRREEARTEIDHNVFLAVESVYSMDGDLAPLAQILKVIRQECPRTKLIVDEAHASGVFGCNGRGLISHLSLASSPELFIRLHTFGKGLGGTGALILCDALVKSYLLNYAKGLIYSTFLSTPALCLMRASLTTLRLDMTSELQDRLWRIVDHLHRALQTLPRTQTLRVPDRLTSPIVPIITAFPIALSSFLEAHGFRVMPVRYPTVPQGAERIRICVRANMRVADIDALVECIRAWILTVSSLPTDTAEMGKTKQQHNKESGSEHLSRQGTTVHGTTTTAKL